MTLITEADLRSRWKRLPNNAPEDKTFQLGEKDILTPSARSYLLEKSVTVMPSARLTTQPQQEARQTIPDYQNAAMKNPEVVFPKEIINIKKFKTLFGAELDAKPEFMTHLKGNILVFKDHPRIAFRGKVDSLETEILLVQSEVNAAGMPGLAEDLEAVLKFVRNLIRCEVMDQRVDDFKVLGLTASDLRAQSHFPKKYFKLGHFMPDYKMPRAVLLVNKLRSMARETEIVAYKAFKDDIDAEGKIIREDILKALNRLSSLFYIMMYWIRTDKYR